MIRLDEIKIQLFCVDTFMGTVLAATPILEENKKCSTLCTDGNRIWYNSEFVEKLSFKEQVAVFAHEVGHIVLLHCSRFRMDRSVKHEVWNIATDYVVNDVLAKYEGKNGSSGQLKLPDSALRMPEKFRDCNSELIYDRLMKENNVEQMIQNFDKQLSDLLDHALDGKEPSGTINGVDVEVIGRIQHALADCHHKGFGGLCNEIERRIGDLVRPELNWKFLLRKYCNEFRRDDYSWAMPSRRSSDFYLPSLCRDGDPRMTSVNVYIDVSGSIGGRTLDIFLSELTYLFDDLGLETMTVQSFSIGLASKQVFTESRDIINYKPGSRGGTEINSVIEDINHSKAMFSIVFTDGEFDESPVSKCRRQIFWLIYGNPQFKPVKGRVAHYRNDNSGN